MENFKKQILSISSGDLNKEQLVSILLLSADMLEINTISEMARIEDKTPSGINNSNNYRKIMIGKQRFAIKGLRDKEIFKHI